MSGPLSARPGDSDTAPHTCSPPQRDPDDRTSWSARRWDCPGCGLRWIYVQRMVGRKVYGEWRQMPNQAPPAPSVPPQPTVPRAPVEALLAALDLKWWRNGLPYPPEIETAVAEVRRNLDTTTPEEGQR